MKFGRRNAIVLGFSILTVSTSTFGFLTYIHTRESFLVLSFILKFVQGVGIPFVETGCNAIACIVYKDTMNEKMGMIQVAFGISFFLGPLLGAGLHSIGGFALPFHILGGTYFIILFLVKRVLPSTVETQPDEIKKGGGIKLRMFFKNIRYVILCISCVTGTISLTAIDPVLAARLLEFGINENLAGVFFPIGAISYGISGIFVGKLAEKGDKQVLIFVGLVMLGIGYFLLGPSSVFHIPNNLYFIPVGQVIAGSGLCFILIPVIPAMIECHESSIPQNETSLQELKDKICGIENSCLGLGSAIGPFLSGSLTQALGFRQMCDVIATLSIGVSIFFFVF